MGVVTFNNSDTELSRFYQSLQKSIRFCRDTEIEFLSLDNGSPSWFSNEKKSHNLATKGNQGFAKAVNSLMEVAFNQREADYFITSNPDGFFHFRTLFELVRSAELHPNCLIEARAFPEEHPKVYNLKNYDTEWASGCCLLIPKAIYEKTGGFDENFFLYLEDVDFSWRVRNLGFGIKYCPDALFSHGLQGRSEGTIPRRKYSLLSGRYFAWKWGLSKFQIQCEEELLNNFGISRATLPALIQPTIPFGNLGKTKAPQFDDFFVFAKVRW